ALLALDHQARRQQVLGREAGAGQVLAQGAAAVRRVAKREALAGLRGDAAALDVAARGLPGRLLHEQRVVVQRGRLVRAAQAVVGLLARRVAVALQRHARARGQLPQRLAELQVVALHDEGKGVAVRAAAEALPGLSLGEDVEGGRLLAVER